MQLKSIKVKLSFLFGALLLLICAGLGIISYRASTNALSSSIDESLSQLAKEASKVVQERINTQLNAMEALAESDSIKNNKLTLNEKLDLLQNEVKRSGHVRMGIADTAGNAKYTDGESMDISDRDYFKIALEGQRTVSDVIVSKVNNNAILCYAIPIKDGNTVKGVLVGTRDGNELSVFTADIHFRESGEAFMISRTGNTVAHKDKNMVMEMYNAFEEVEKNPELKPLIELEKQMTEGKEGMGEYTYKGITKYMGFTPVEGTNWSLAITAPKSETMAKVNSLTKTILIVSIILLGIGIAIISLIASGISKPIKMASDYLTVVATGDFTKEVPEGLLRMKDETGVLANAIHTMQQSIKIIINEVVDESSNISRMLININAEMEQLNKSIEGISATTEELSAGTEETASSTEEMHATSTEIEKVVESIASKAQEGAVTVGNVNKMAEEMKQNAITSKENTIRIYGRTKNSLQSAIEQSKAVNQINQLSEAILAITSQTNLLALNAALRRPGQVSQEEALQLSPMKSEIWQRILKIR